MWGLLGFGGKSDREADECHIQTVWCFGLNPTYAINPSCALGSWDRATAQLEILSFPRAWERVSVRSNVHCSPFARVMAATGWAFMQTVSRCLATGGFSKKP